MDANLISVRDSLVESLDTDWDQLSNRINGLTDAEYLWCAAEGPCWSVALSESGEALADLEKPDPVPPPFTTIAWRMWHMGPDCLDSYSSRLFGTNGTGIDDRSWTMSADEAWALLERSFRNFRAGIATSTPEQMMEPIGDAFGPFAHKNRIDLALHAEREIVHHGAEIALLRDLFRDG